MHKMDIKNLPTNKQAQKLLKKQLDAVAKIKEECTSLYGPDVGSNKPYVDPSTQSIMCPPYYDTMVCWQPEFPNTTSVIPCPSYIVGFIPENKATRYCTETGEWFMKEFEGKSSPYADYDSCYTNQLITVFTNFSEGSIGSWEDSYLSEKAADMISLLTMIGNAISLVALLIAFTIMFKIKKLHCARNILHMNLFASFILRAFMSILKEALFENGLGLSKDFMEHNGGTFFHVNVNDNNFECKLIVSIKQYFQTANYSWILVEGLYLNNLILRALFTDSNKNLLYYIIFGWGFPILVVVPWVTARILVEDELCWTKSDNAKVFAIINVPMFASVLINLVLFVIISVVLYKKLKSPVNEDSRRYLKWAKSTLVLVPLFGVNSGVLMLLYLCNMHIIWLICDMLSGSLQGFFVAILYCFLNGEVKSEVKPYITSLLIFLATNDITKYCFPKRETYLSSAVGRQSVCTTMSCSSLYNNGLNPHRNSRTKFDQLSKIKLSNLHGGTDCTKEVFVPNGVKHSASKNGANGHQHQGHYTPNLTFVHGRYPLCVTTNNVDLSFVNDTRQLPICEEEVSMLNDVDLSKEK
ncbi:vasoactive intestinal polypeptide receptor 2-like isoform X1 [Euwallacea fornicatus]|uniref:vasoactive intestinal polypeptide receptor 2-like isoform X1 n=2 Tax=Euwallacea fornicatus TaxID=995702 RepID=UPI00338EDBAE